MHSYSNKVLQGGQDYVDKYFLVPWLLMSKKFTLEIHKHVTQLPQEISYLEVKVQFVILVLSKEQTFNEAGNDYIACEKKAGIHILHARILHQTIHAQNKKSKEITVVSSKVTFCIYHWRLVILIWHHIP